MESSLNAGSFQSLGSTEKECSHITSFKRKYLEEVPLIDFLIRNSITDCQTIKKSL